MKDVSRRDFFAALADVSWMRNAQEDYISARTGVSHPPLPLNDTQMANFMNRAERAWRWRYADTMLKGFES